MIFLGFMFIIVFKLQEHRTIPRRNDELYNFFSLKRGIHLNLHITLCILQRIRSKFFFTIRLLISIYILCALEDILEVIIYPVHAGNLRFLK